MTKSIVAEGKTINEAIENGLKQLKASKADVDIKVLEEEKRSFFSILTPRVVKVELTLKEEVENTHKHIKNNNEKVIKIDSNEIEKAKQKTESFLKEFISKLPDTEVKFDVKVNDGNILVDMHGEKVNYLIGYRGETLNALQTVLNSVANRDLNGRVRVNLDIENYREKRVKALEELAEKISKTVVKTGKSITLEPMSAYERKIIHSKLQNSTSVKTYSVGSEPHRKIVISLK